MKVIAETLGVSRSNLYERRQKDASSSMGNYRKPEDEVLVSLIREIVDERPTYGYPRTTAILNRWLQVMGRVRVNRKRVYRIMKRNGLLLERYMGRPARIHEGQIVTPASDKRWCSDIFEIPCWNRDRVRVAFVMDCCDREVISYLASTSGISGEMIRDLMVEAIEARFGLASLAP